MENILKFIRRETTNFIEEVKNEFNISKYYEYKFDISKHEELVNKIVEFDNYKLALYENK